MKQNRFKSPVVWTGFVGGLISILALWGVFEKIGIPKEVILATTTFIIVSLTSFGLLNDPTNKEGF